MNVLRSLTFSFAFYCKIASFGEFERSQGFFGKTHLFFLQRKADFWMFCEILLIHSHSSENLLPVAIFKKYSFFRKTHMFLEQMIEFSTVLRNLTYSLAFYTDLLHWATFQNNQGLFPKTHHFFPSKNLNFERFGKSY